MALIFLKTIDGVQPLWVEHGQIIDPDNLPGAVRAQMGDPLMMKLCRLTIPALLNFLDACGCDIAGLKKMSKQGILGFITDNWEHLVEDVHRMAHPTDPIVMDASGATVQVATASASASDEASSVEASKGEGYVELKSESKPVEHLKWTDDDEKRLTILLKLNSNPMGFSVDSDKLAELIEKKGKVQLSKLPPSLVAGSSPVSIGEGEKEVMITIPTLNGTFKLKCCYFVGMTGSDVNQLLETVLHGVDLSLFRLKVSNAPSYIQKYDNIDNYIDEKSSLELVPAVRGGGKVVAVKKKMEKVSVFKNKLDEKAKVLNDHTLEDVAVMEHKISVFLQDIDAKGAPDAIESLINGLGIEHLEEMKNYMDTTTSGGTATRIRFLSPVMFGEPMKKIVRVSETCEHLKESCAVCLNYAITKASVDTSYTLKSLREVVEKYLNQRIGARDTMEL